jgi:crotonobetainyl-CoA:carnitine CoA-transferase CaiB-like acyl-CoA transferase
MTLDLKSEEGKAIFKKLVAQSDVSVKTSGWAQMERLGLAMMSSRRSIPRSFTLHFRIRAEGPLSQRPCTTSLRKPWAE